MEISIIVPTRKRINLLSKLLDSINTKTNNLSCVEVIAIYDEDDLETGKFLFKQNFKWLRILSRDRGDNLSRDYYNWAVNFANGKYLWALNDDAEIETKNWDQYVLNAMKEYEIGIGSVSCPHYDFSNQVSPFSYFPIMTKKSIEKLGYFLPEEFPGWGADDKLAKLFDLVGKNIQIPEVKIKHINGKKLKDECFEAMELRSFFGFADVMNHKIKIEEEAMKLS